MIKNSTPPLREYQAPKAEVFALTIKRTILSISNEEVAGKNDEDIQWTTE